MKLLILIRFNYKIVKFGTGNRINNENKLESRILNSNQLYLTCVAFFSTPYTKLFTFLHNKLLCHSNSSRSEHISLK